MIVLESALAALAVYLTCHVVYDLFLVIVNIIVPDRQRALVTPRTFFGVLMPSHDEELLLPRTLKSLDGQDYPRNLFRAIVVADNCSDKTADIARLGGALVLERHNPHMTGKGHAIRFALEHIDLREYGAIVIVDADSVVASDFLLQLDEALQKGDRIIQCYNGVGNPGTSWFTRLLDVSRTLSNEVFHPAKGKLGLSSFLMGNGMCFSRSVLEKYGWNAFTVGEDWEYYACLITAGEKVSFSQRARVYHQESSTLRQATSQRIRWSSGRIAVLAKYGLGMFARGLWDRNIVAVDASLPLIFPNPSLGINLTIGGAVLSLLLGPRSHGLTFVTWFGILALAQIAMFVYGAFLTRDKWNNVASLVVAPAFLAWKMGIDVLSAFGVGRKTWVKTQRKL